MSIINRWEAHLRARAMGKSLRYHNETFYLCFSSNDTRKFYIFQTKDIESGKWQRSTIDGIYHDPALLFDDDMGYQNQGIAQSAIFDTPDQEWYAMLFQDHGAVGRIPYVLPVRWEEGWSMFGIDGKASETFEVNLPPSTPKPLVASDEFNHEENVLGYHWQWNHNPDHHLWSFTERPGCLRLKTG